MNYFFGFNPTLEQEILFFFNLNHLILLFLVIGILLSLFFGIHAKTRKGIKLTQLALGSAFLVLETGRLVWFIAERVYIGLPISFEFWFSIIPFSYCGVMSITAGIVLIATAVKSDNQTMTMQIFYNILFSLGMLGGLLTFSAPGIFDNRFSLLHFRNFQTVTVHILLIFAPLHLIKTEMLKVRWHNVWMAVSGFLGTAAIMMTASQISGVNRGWALYIEEMVQYAGVYIPFPWHLLVLFLALFIVPLLFYSFFELNYKRMSNQSVAEVPVSYGVNMSVIVCGLLLGLAGILVIPLAFPRTPIGNMWGLLCLIPLVIIIGSIILARSIFTNRLY